MATQAAVDAAAQGVKELARESDLPEWMRRTDISVDIQENDKPSWSIETIQPIHQASDLSDTWFWQGRFAHDSGTEDETLNLGVGYRHLLDDHSWMFGANVFYDYTFEDQHERVGVGAEAFGRYTTLRANYYIPVDSSPKTVADNTTEEVLQGWDFEVEAPVPYLPWMRVAFTAYEWDSDTTKDIEGGTLGLRAHPSDNLEIEVGGQNDTYGRKEGFLKLTWHFDRPDGVEYTALRDGISDSPFVARDLTRHTLDKVRRHHDGVVERVASGVVIARGN